MSYVSATVSARAALEIMDERNKVATLEPECRLRANAVLLLLAIAGYGRARVRSCRRSLIEEEVLYGQGRSEAELRAAGVDPSLAVPRAAQVTWTLPIDADHVCGQAMDVGFEMYMSVQWEVVQSICRMLNLEWGGLWKVRDMGHFSFRQKYNGD